MPIPLSTSMPLAAARAQTQSAADAALKAGLITPQQLARMTDGTVSAYDHNQAEKILKEQVKKGIQPDTGTREIAANLANAVGTQLLSEDEAVIRKESAKDMRADTLAQVWSTTEGIGSSFGALLSKWGAF